MIPLIISRKILKDSRVIIFGQKGNLRIFKGKTVIYYRKNYRMNCREYPGAEMPKEINMVLISISRYDLWDRKK